MPGQCLQHCQAAGVVAPTYDEIIGEVYPSVKPVGFFIAPAFDGCNQHVKLR